MPSDQQHPFDRPTAEDLRARGSLKWTALDGDIAAWVAESDFGLAPPVAVALQDAVDRGLVGYLPPWARGELAEATAAFHEDRYGWSPDPARIHPVGDVREALHATVAHFSRPGSPVILPTPAYMPFVTIPVSWGRSVLQVPMLRGPGGRMALDLAGIEEAFRAGGHVVVLVNPHNPTGRVHTREELIALADVVERHGGRVFADEVHAPLVYPGHQHVPYAALSAVTAAHTITATSASKAWNVAGLKCAQVILSNAVDAAHWREHDSLLTAGTSTLGAVANTAAYRAAGPWLDEVLAHLDGNRTALADVLADVAPAVGYREPEGTYLAWLDLRDALASRAGDDQPRQRGLAAWLRRRSGVAVVDGAACGTAGQGFIRMNLAMPRPLVVEAGRRIGAGLRRTD